MQYSINLQDKLPVLKTAFHSDFVFSEDGIPYSNRVKTILDSLSEPVYYFFDLRDWKEFSLEDLIQATNIAARQGNSNFHHAMVREVLIITEDPRLQFSANNLKRDIYGNVSLRIFITPEDAMAHIRADIAKRSAI